LHPILGGTAAWMGTLVIAGGITALIGAVLAAYSIYAGETSFLDVAIGYALIAFLGTVALARFLPRSALKKSENPEIVENMRRHE
jgi:multisubunit Na+/H+ antiporter MnhF subunit